MNKIETLLSKISDRIDRFTNAQIIAAILLLVGFLVYFVAAMIALSENYKAFSGIPYAVSKALIGCAVLKLVDEIMLYEVPTMKNLKENATAYSLYMLGYAVVVALAIATA